MFLLFFNWNWQRRRECHFVTYLIRLSGVFPTMWGSVHSRNKLLPSQGLNETPYLEDFTRLSVNAKIHKIKNIGGFPAGGVLEWESSCSLHPLLTTKQLRTVEAGVHHSQNMGREAGNNPARLICNLGCGTRSLVITRHDFCLGVRLILNFSSLPGVFFPATFCCFSCTCVWPVDGLLS